MVVIRCTKKLLDRVKPPSLAPVETVGSNILGAWYATGGGAVWAVGDGGAGAGDGGFVSGGRGAERRR